MDGRDWETSVQHWIINIQTNAHSAHGHTRAQTHTQTHTNSLKRLLLAEQKI